MVVYNLYSMSVLPCSSQNVARRQIGLDTRHSDTWIQSAPSLESLASYRSSLSGKLHLSIALGSQEACVRDTLNDTIRLGLKAKVRDTYGVSEGQRETRKR
jgi:hypothetical protein